MPPRGEQELVTANTIINGQDLLNEEWRLNNLVPLIPHDDPLAYMRWLATGRLIKNSVMCNACRNPCTLNRYAQSINDKHRWWCNDCNYTESVHSGSFFSKSNLHLSKIITIIYFW